MPQLLILLLFAVAFGNLAGLAFFSSWRKTRVVVPSSPESPEVLKSAQAEPAEPQSGETLAPAAADPPAVRKAFPLVTRRLRDTLAQRLRAHWPEVLALLAALALGAYVLQVSSVAMERGNTTPKEPGHPFYGLHYVREFQLEHANKLPLVLVTLALLLGVGLPIASRLREGRSVAGFRVGLLVGALGIAGVAQLALNNVFPAAGVPLYALAALLFVAWAIAYRPNLEADLLADTWPRWLEWSMLALAVGVTIFARAYALQRVPYGIEGDESKWTIEVISATVDGLYPESTEYHFSSVPLSFLMQAPFHALFGPGIVSGRVAVVTFSVLGSLAFFWFARQIAGARVAWLATLLLALSPMDISASRLGNVESHVKLWPVLTLALLALAVRRRRLLTYGLAGACVAFGLLTYDTVAPLAVVGLLIVVLELARSRAPVREWVLRLCAFLAPIAVVTPITAVYLIGRLSYYEVGSQVQPGGSRLTRAFVDLQQLLHSLFVQTFGDFLYNRQGPVFNAALLPWLMLGTVLAVVCWRRGRLLWVLIFGGLFFFPVPIIAHIAAGRVFYPALPAAYFLMALALVAAYREIERSLSPLARPVLVTAAGVLLVYLGATNLYIYFNEVQDAQDRQLRREIYEASLAAAGGDTMVYYPYVPASNEPLEQERDHLIWLGARVPGARGERYPYAVLPLQSLLPQLAANQGYARAEVVWDTLSPALRPEREAVREALLRCYPGTERLKGTAFDRYVIPEAVLRAPRCSSGVLSLATQQTEARANEPVMLQWTLDGTPAPQLNLVCETSLPNTMVVPGEKLAGPGWEAISKFVSGFEGDGFLADNIGSQPATALVPTPQAAQLYVWVRSLRRVVDDYPGYIGFGSQLLPFARADESKLNRWVWERVGPLNAPPSGEPLTLSRPNPLQDGFIALFVDTLILTDSPDFDPERDALWQPFVDEPLDAAAGGATGTATFSGPPGLYRCRVRATESARLIDASGRPGLTSNDVELRVLP